MRSLAKILEQKDLIAEYCDVFNFSNPRILYLAGENYLNLVVDDNDAENWGHDENNNTGSYDILLQELLTEKFDCHINIVIDEFSSSFKEEALKKMVSLDDTNKIESIFKKSLDLIMIADRDVGEVSLAQAESIKAQITEVFKRKGLSSPFLHLEVKEIKMGDKKNKWNSKSSETFIPDDHSNLIKEKHENQLFKKKRLDENGSSSGDILRSGSPRVKGK